MKRSDKVCQSVAKKVTELPIKNILFSCCPKCGSSYLSKKQLCGVRIKGCYLGVIEREPNGIEYYKIWCEDCYFSITAEVNINTGLVSFDGIF